MQMTTLCTRCQSRLGDRYIVTPQPERGARTCGICGQTGTVCEIWPKKAKKPNIVRFPQANPEKEAARRRWA